MADPLDPRLYGLAPKTSDAHDGEVLWTILGVMQYLNVKSETTIRANKELMQMRRVLSPGVHRWVPREVRAYAESKPKPGLSKRLQRILTGADSDIAKANRKKGWEKWQDRTRRQRGRVTRELRGDG